MCKNSEQRRPQSLPVQSIAEINFTRGRTKNFMASISLKKVSPALGMAFTDALSTAQTVNLLIRKRFNQKYHDECLRFCLDDNSATRFATTHAVKIARVKNFVQPERFDQKFHSHTFILKSPLYIGSCNPPSIRLCNPKPRKSCGA